MWIFCWESTSSLDKMEVLQTCLAVKLNLCLLLNIIVISVISDISALHFIHHSPVFPKSISVVWRICKIPIFCTTLLSTILWLEFLYWYKIYIYVILKKSMNSCNFNLSIWEILCCLIKLFQSAVSVVCIVRWWSKALKCKLWLHLVMII